MKDINKHLADLDEMDLTEMKAEMCKRSLYYFLKEFWQEQCGDPFIDSPQIKFLCDAAQRIGMRIVNDEVCEKLGAVVNCPPGISKSTVFSIMLNAWLWIHNPAIKIVSASCTVKIATENTKKTLLVVNSDKYKIYFPWVELGNTQNILHFTTTKHGQRFACSSGSSVRGTHGILLIADDIDSDDTVNNDIEREKLQSWITSNFLTRKSNNEKAQVIFIQQRLGRMDSSNFLLETGNYEHICLPAEYNEATVKPSIAKVLYQDGLLNPTRYSKKTLDAKRVELGTAGYNAQYLQNPAGEGNDGIIHKGWIDTISYSEWRRISDKKFYTVNFYCDPATTTNRKRNDPSVILACATIDNKMYILNVAREWLETPELIKFIQQWTANNNYSTRSKIMVEPKGGGLNIIQMIRSQTRLNVIPGIAYNKKQGDKAFRLAAVSPIIESKRVLLVEGKYVKEFLDEVTVMDTRHDDMKDVLSMSVNDQLAKPSFYGNRSFY